MTLLEASQNQVQEEKMYCLVTRKKDGGIINVLDSIPIKSEMDSSHDYLVINKDDAIKYSQLLEAAGLEIQIQLR